MPDIICVSSAANETISDDNKGIIAFAQEFALSDSCRPGDCRPN